jgi:hypothetical protein
MEINQSANRIHPLVAGAAVSVTLVSLLGAAAITGLLPKSHSNAAPTAALTAPAATPIAAPVAAPVANLAPVAAPIQAAEVRAPAPVKVVEKTRVIYRTVQAPRPKPVAQYSDPAPRYTQVSSNYGQPYPQPAVMQQPAAQPAAQQNSMVGMAAGAVVGGLLGNQVGGGNGKKLATVAGVIGGGYIGNEIGKRNGF